MEIFQNTLMVSIIVGVVLIFGIIALFSNKI